MLLLVVALLHLSENYVPTIPAVTQVELSSASNVREIPLENWQQATLPVRFCKVVKCSHNYEVLRYEFTITNPTENWGIYLPLFESSALIAVNGHAVVQLGKMIDPVDNHAGMPELITLLPNQLRAGKNQLTIHFAEINPGFGKLAPFYVGPLSALEGPYEVRNFLQVTVLRSVIYLIFPVLIFLLVLALRSQRDATLLAFSALLAFYLVRASNEIVVTPWFDHDWHSTIYYFSTLGLVASAYSFVSRWVADHKRSIEAVYWLVVISGTLFSAFMLHNDFISGIIESNRITRFAVLFGLPLPLYLIVKFVISTWSWTNAWIAATLLTTAGLAIFDTIQSWPPAMPEAYYANLGPPLLVIAFAIELAQRHAAAARAVADANVHLGNALREREAELAANYEHMQTIEQERLLMEERQRIMRDMHDGVGGRLAALSSQFRRGGISEASVELTIKESLQDLRLLISSLDTDLEDLDIALGSLRPRLQSWLAEHDISLVWSCEVDAVSGFGPQAVLNVYRVIQEACNNSIRHAEANTVSVNLHTQDNHLYLEVSDDGHGEQPGRTPGRGLANMQTRICELGGTFASTSSEQGFSVNCAIPLPAIPA